MNVLWYAEYKVYIRTVNLSSETLKLLENCQKHNLPVVSCQYLPRSVHVQVVQTLREFNPYLTSQNMGTFYSSLMCKLLHKRSCMNKLRMIILLNWTILFMLIIINKKLRREAYLTHFFRLIAPFLNALIYMLYHSQWIYILKGDTYF